MLKPILGKCIDEYGKHFRACFVSDGPHTPFLQESIEFGLFLVNKVVRRDMLDVQHISAYHLIYEKQTKLYALLQKGSVRPVTDEASTEMFSILIDTLAQNGFEHYEISNFAKDKKYSVHNTSYWKNEKYIGLGPSAHSYNGKSRSWNVASLEKYITEIQSGRLLQETEKLNSVQKYNEFILTGLRTMWGVNLNLLKEEFGQELLDYCLQNARKFIREGLIISKDNSLIMTRKGIFISDGIMSELMRV